MDPMDEDPFLVDESQSESDEDSSICDYSNSSSDHDGSDSDEDSDDYEDSDVDENEETYKFLEVADIREYQERDITKVSAVLAISRAEAKLLLVYFRWNAKKATVEWLAQTQLVRNEIGLLDVPIAGMEISDANDMICGICSGIFPQELVAAASCGHIYCKPCWADYIGKMIKDDRECLSILCPQESCYAAVDSDMINMLASDEDKRIYEHSFLMSYINCNSKATWCPGPRCNYAVLKVRRGTSYKVTCNCNYSFCWQCNKEAHHPISCAIVAKWGNEKFLQAENWKIIETTTMCCTKCGQSLVPNTVAYKCMYCAACDIQFCRVCRVPWMHRCVFKDNQWIHECVQATEENIDEQVKRAQESLIRFNKTYVRWGVYDQHVKSSLNQIPNLKTGQLRNLIAERGLTEAELSFVVDAWLQVAECKRVFKWSCIYSYYLPEDEKAMRNFATYLLGLAGNVTYELAKIAARLPLVLNMIDPVVRFQQFREILLIKTSVARNFFNNVLWAIEKGHYPDLNTLRLSLRLRSMQLGITGRGPSGNLREPGRGLRICPHCRFINDDGVSICLMCYH